MVQGIAPSGDGMQIVEERRQRPRLRLSVGSKGRRAVVASTLALAMTAVALAVTLVFSPDTFYGDVVDDGAGQPGHAGNFLKSAGVSGFGDQGWHGEERLGAGHLEMSGGRRLLMLQTSMLVAGLGEGLFAIIILYLVLAATCFIGCRIDNAWVVYVPMFLIILIISLVLFLAPKVPRSELEREAQVNSLRIFDGNYIPQTTIIVAIFVGMIIAFILWVCCHCVKPVYVRSLDD